eukprot:TRINITY_DN15818_c0_g1_i1.p1 TRINITY_DN15818_c0_g1~~TRINITY_DN15818_c0_g1_i1.p1  ORF type:complete len:303 (-),score=59.91 TRINITY_DN15818_c0_g1_i1:58-966(-)
MEHLGVPVRGAARVERLPDGTMAPRLFFVDPSYPAPDRVSTENVSFSGCEAGRIRRHRDGAAYRYTLVRFLSRKVGFLKEEPGWQGRQTHVFRVCTKQEAQAAVAAGSKRHMYDRAVVDSPDLVHGEVDQASLVQIWQQTSLVSGKRAKPESVIEYLSSAEKRQKSLWQEFGEIIKHQREMISQLPDEEHRARLWEALDLLLEQMSQRSEVYRSLGTRVERNPSNPKAGGATPYHEFGGMEKLCTAMRDMRLPDRGLQEKDHLVSPKSAVIVLSLIHISEPTRLLSISYAVFCLKKKKIYNK